MKKYKYKLESAKYSTELYIKLSQIPDGYRCVNVIYNSKEDKYIIIYEKEIINE